MSCPVRQPARWRLLLALPSILCAGCAIHFPPDVVIEPTFRLISNSPPLQLTSYHRQFFDPLPTPTTATDIPPTAIADVPVEP